MVRSLLVITIFNNLTRLAPALAVALLSPREGLIKVKGVSASRLCFGLECL